MTYRERLELYKRNELESEQKHQVEADIEKQEAIGDYLYEKDDIPALKAIFGEQAQVPEEASVSSSQEQDFMRMVKQSIHKAFLKVGVIASAIALVILLLVQLVLPHIVSAFYYNPGRELGKYTNQISLDMAVYTELMIPQYIRYQVNVEALGYGKYDYCINQNSSYNGVFTNVTGRIERGRIILYDSNTLKTPASNAFAHSVAYKDPSRSLSELEAASQVSMGAAGFPSDNLTYLDALSDDNKYVAYVTLEKLMEYTPFLNFIQDNSILDAWCAVRTNWNPTTSTMLQPENLGFQYGQSSHNLSWDKERYPNLMAYDYDLISSGDPNLYHDTMFENFNDEAFMQKHFTDLLRYLSDQKKFIKMMDLDSKKLTNAADFVEENGLLIYGFAIVANKEQILKLAEQDKVYLIYTQPLR